jgi:hypothetical protein
MTNTGKVLIIGLLVVDLGVGGYLLFPKDDERPPAAAGTEVVDTAIPARSDTPANAAQMASGSVVGAPPAAGETGKLAMAPSVPSVPPVPSVARRAPAPSVVAVAPPAGQAVPRVVDKPPVKTREQASSELRRNSRAQSKPVQLTEQQHGHKHDDPHHRESKSLSSAMTDRLVKESAKPDPSLPLPPSTAHGSHPVDAAMTDQLIRESSRVNAASGPQYGKH